MKKMRLIVVMMFVLCLMACGTQDETETLAVSLVSGYHDNAQIPNFYSETVQNAFSSACKTYGHIKVIVNDGAPYIALDAQMKPPAKEGLSENKKATIAEKQVQEINGIISMAKAKTEEANPMEAIHLAARALRSTQTQRKVLLVLDNGLGTAGVMNFVTGNLLQQDAQACAEAVISQLLSSGEIGGEELTGVDVIWSGLGDVAGEQMKLTPGERETLKAVWKAILQEMGAQTVTLAEDLPTGVYEEGLPEVSLVETGKSQNVFLESEAFMNGNEPMVLDDTIVSFVPDSAEVLNAEEAKEILKPLAEYLCENLNKKILLAGTTATVGNQKDCEMFSKKRAYTIAGILEEMGVLRGQMQVMGLGFEHEYHVNDLDEKGRLLEVEAQKNRSVMIINSESDMAQRLKLHFEVVDL